KLCTPPILKVKLIAVHIEAESASMTTELDDCFGAQRRKADSPPPLPAFFRIHDVLRITALSRPTLYRRIAARRFPAPVHLGGRGCGWSSGALQNWIADPERYREPLATKPCPPGSPHSKCAPGKSATNS